MQSDELYYRQSGRFNSTAPLGILIPGVIVALIAGAVYGAAVFLIPFIYINFLLTFALGGVIGWVVYKLSVSQHVRNAKLALLFGFLAGLAAEYAAFVGWVFAISEWEYFAIWPADLWLAVTALGENGVWTLFGGDPVSGLWLYAV